MPRADGRIEPGQKLTSAISARAWNRAQQAADIVLGANPSVSADGFVGQVAPNTVYVRNDSGLPVPVCGVLACSSSIVTQPQYSDTLDANGGSATAKAFFNRPVLIGIKPDSLNIGSVLIAMEPVASGAVGRFAVGGCFPCKVKRTSLNHRYARGRVDDVTQLISTECGPVQLLWCEPTLGDDRWALGLI